MSRMHRPVAHWYSLALITALAAPPACATEGMWLPTLLGSIESDMQTMGMQLSAEDIYSVNHTSLKDAIILFGGGCTAEVLSARGLILTNHHCGFGAIQDHSSVENDLLKNGFWAAKRADELRNPGLSATFIIRMEDVTDRVLAELPNGLTEQQRREAFAKVADAIAKQSTAGTHHNATVRPFNYGNSFFLIVTETFRDVRLVGAPPGSIGNFGGDTDNWMWPRHTGDFSMFRIYAGADNKPADFALTNVPFTPRHSLPISMDGVKEGEFDMVFGFPGNTQRYLTSYAVDYVTGTGDPLKIRMRQASLAVIDQAMLASDRTRIQYADKQKGISNAYKKWIGELRGLNELKTVDRKREQEAEFRTMAAGTPYATVLDELQQAYVQQVPLARARDLFTEFVFVGPELLRFTDAFKGIVNGYEDLQATGKLEGEVDRLKGAARGFYKDYDKAVDERIFKALLPIYRQNVDAAHAPASLSVIDSRFKGSTDAFTADLYARTVFVDSVALFKALDAFSPKVAKRLAKDPAFVLSQDFYKSFLEGVRPDLAAASDRIETGMRTYTKGLMTLYPDRTWWPDANSTLRLSYGKVEGSSPRDGMAYLPFTYLDGVLEKYKPGDAEFDVPKRMLELHAARDYGEYGEGGRMPVCFTSSLHTTGGNSGSPVINGHGELVGINFDRSWESTMSDIQFDPAKCRNIAADIRYVLFVVDKVCGARHLVDEMVLVHHADAPHVIGLPIHR
jgi:hypothetical protein